LYAGERRRGRSINLNRALLAVAPVCKIGDQQMAEITGWQVVGCVNGGSANKGQDVHFTLRVKGDGAEQDIGFFIDHGKLAEMISHLLTYGGLARDTRLRIDPSEETEGSFAGAHALGLADVFPGRSVTNPELAILTLQFHAGRAGQSDLRLNLYCAANATALGILSSACTKAAQILEDDDPKLSTH